TLMERSARQSNSECGHPSRRLLLLVVPGLDLLLLLDDGGGVLIHSLDCLVQQRPRALRVAALLCADCSCKQARELCVYAGPGPSHIASYTKEKALPCSWLIA